MSEENTHPPPPPHLKKYKRPDFGEHMAGTVPQVVERFLSEERFSARAAEQSLGELIRNYVFSRCNREKYVNMAMEHLKNKEICLKKRYDIILIGAGIHAALFTYTIKRLVPEINILVLESGSNICATFFKMGDALILNSPTFPKVGLNSNIVQGHFVQLTDFDELVEKPFPTGRHIHELASMIFFHSDADIVFNKPVNEIRNKAKTSQIVCVDHVLECEQVIISNGMGEPKNWNFSKSKLSKQVILGDDFISMCRDDKFFTNHIKNKKIAVVGDGDTANCVMEYLLPLVYPNNCYGFRQNKRDLPKLIFWIGQPAENIQDYFFENKSRYCHSGGLIEFFWHGESPFELSTRTWRKIRNLIRCIPEKLASLNPSESCVEVKTKSESIVVDLVVNCTVRKNLLAETLLDKKIDYVKRDVTLYGGQWHPKHRRFVVYPRTIENTKIAVKIRNRNIYLIGSACPLDQLIPDSEAKDGSLRYLDDRRSLTNSKWSMEHSLPRTVALAEVHAQVLKA